MRKILSLLAALSLCALAGAAQAQIKCWNDANGKRVCGDTPPPGARPTTIKGPASSAEPAPAAKGAAAKSATAKKGPLTPAEQEQEYRKRKAEQTKAAEKSAQADKDSAAKKQNCEQARNSARTLESGQRISRTHANGEPYFLDESQIAQELSKAKQLQQEWCN